MNILRKLSNRLIYVLSVTVLIVVPGLAPVNAKDTDIYLLAPSSTTDDKPNVLIILDNSGSMSDVLAAHPAYDASIDYCTADLNTLYPTITDPNAGKPSTCASSLRTYWSFGSTPPSISSTQWFLSTRNKCFASLSPTSGLATAGIFAGTKIAGWRSGSGNGWKTLDGKNDSIITYVDCQQDSDANGLVAGDNKREICLGTSGGCSITSAYADSSTGGAFSWSGFNGQNRPTLYTPNYMNYYHNALLQDDITRMDVAKDAVNSLIDTYTSVRYGLMTFNRNNTSSTEGGRVLMRIANMDDARRTAMKNIVNTLSPGGSTPLTETLWEAYRYLGGLGTTYGNPATTQTPHQDSCAQNVANSACNNGGYYDAIAAGSPAYNDGTYISPYTYGCQKSFIIYVTDGDPTSDTAADADIEALTGASCSGSCLNELAGHIHNNDIYTGLPDPQTVVTYTIALGDGISTSGATLLDNTASAGGGDYFTAVDGGELNAALQQVLNEILKVDTSFSAPSLSVNAFNRLYNRDDIYFALFTPNSTKAWDGNLKKFRLCNGTETSPTCTFGDIVDSGNIAAIDTSIDPATLKPRNKIKNGEASAGNYTAKSYWSTVNDGSDVIKGGAGEKITNTAKVPRALHTYRDLYSNLTTANNVVPIVATSGNTVYDAAVADPTILGLPSTTTVTPTNDKVAQLINWMRGRDAYDDNDNCASGLDTEDPANFSNSCLTETRPWNFADPLHSRPVAFTYGCVGGSPCTASSDPIIKLFVGTNDGMVRIINNSTGEEEWAFMPSEMLSSQYALSQNDTGDHIYGLDDSPAFLINDVNNDGIIDPATDKVYMYIGMRRGGRNIYAFDVTPTDAMDAQTDTVTPKLIWVIKGGAGDFAQLGQTWSRPKIARVRAQCTPSSVCSDGNPSTNDSKSRMVLIFGGGYDTNQDSGIPSGPDAMGKAIYMVDPFTGQRIWWASDDAGSSLPLTKMKYSIPSEVTALDTDGDKSVDRLYVGDTGGQLWRIDLGDQIGDGTDGGSDGYVFADVGCGSVGGATPVRRVHDTAGDCPVSTTKQDLRKFFYPPDVAQVKDAAYSSSENYDLVTIGSGDREDPLDLLTSSPTATYPVHNRIYAIRDYNFTTGIPASVPTTPLSEFEMYDATANNLATLTGTARQTEIDDNVKPSKGWFIDLVEPNAVTLLNGLSSTWAGEKVLAKTVVFGGVLYATTFLPANQATVASACTANEGEARAYALNYLTGEGVYNLDSTTGIDRFAVIGGGIPSEVVIVIRDGGVTGLVGTSGGAAGVTVGGALPKYKTYWYDE
jgi:type IV pilus assembly protein PilY1